MPHEQVIQQYKKGYLQGKSDRANNTGAGASRLWVQAYRYGYSDGYAGR